MITRPPPDTFAKLVPFVCAASAGCAQPRACEASHFSVGEVPRRGKDEITTHSLVARLLVE